MKSIRSEIILTEMNRPTVITSGQRMRLPNEVPPREGFSLWEIIKPNLGRDFSRFKVPVNINEPVTLLQRLAETYMGYVDLILKAMTKESPVERMELIVAYAISGISTNRNRLTKPFNPLLLETFEHQKDECRFIAEQVSNHPPISNLYMEGPGFTLSATVSPKVSFWMNRLICTPNSSVCLILNGPKIETYTWQTPTCTIWNVMIGKPYMNLSGNMIVRCSSTNYEGRINFDSNGGWNRQKTTDLHLDGYINHGKTPVRAIYGNWSLYVASCAPRLLKENYSQWVKSFISSVYDKPERGPIFGQSNILWIANKLPEKYEMQYHFTYMTMTLNTIPHSLKNLLPPTDSRMRPDMIKMEYGLLDSAGECKEYIEQMQRIRRKEGGRRTTPKWFIRNKNGWSYNGMYWNREYDDCEDIFRDPSGYVMKTARETR